MKRLLMLGALLIPLAMATLSFSVTAGEAQQTVQNDGWTNMVVGWAGKVGDAVADAAVDVVKNPVVKHAIAAMLGGALLSVLVTEFLKRFSPLVPWLFEGKHWLLKLRALAAVIGGLLACLMGPDGVRHQLVLFVAGAAASPTMYDVAYWLAPKLMDRVMTKVRGDAA